MDLMEVRRNMMGVIAGMASGARFVKGTFTTDSNDPYIINFGQTFDKYMYYIEMTEESKTHLLETGESSTKAFALFGVSFTPDCKGYTYNYNYMCIRIVPSTKATSYIGNTATDVNGSSMKILNRLVTSTTSGSLYQGYSYNYYIVEMK